MWNPYDSRRFTVNEVVEIMSPKNRWYTAEALGREPTTEELIRHYTKHTVPQRVISFNVEPTLFDDT
jgi:hypothetical protein